jgi:hypothetical protein
VRFLGRKVYLGVILMVDLGDLREDADVAGIKPLDSRLRILGASSGYLPVLDEADKLVRCVTPAETQKDQI